MTVKDAKDNSLEGTESALTPCPTEVRKSLLDWYDSHRRDLPWRYNPGQRANPYKVWLSEIMLQQTTVTAVIPYFYKFVEKWPSVFDLAKASQEDVMDAWAGLGYYSRAKNLHKCAQIIANEYSGEFPDDIQGLKKLPGIGDYTSAAIRSIAFDKDASVLDGNVERVLSRLFCITEPLPKSKKTLKALLDRMTADNPQRPGDFAQAMMDIGATICTPKQPKCLICPLSSICIARSSGVEKDLPNKEKKKPNPIKYGNIYWCENEKGEVLIERRSDKGMLANMNGFPTTEWVLDQSQLVHPETFGDINAYKPLKERVIHSFTHFDIVLMPYRIDFNAVDCNDKNNRYQWVSKGLLKEIKFPTLFNKFYRIVK